MSQEALEGFRDLFLLNPEIQNRLRLKVSSTSPVDLDECLELLVNEGRDHRLIFTKEELADAIVNYGKNLRGEASACEVMTPPHLSQMRVGIPARPAQGKLPAKPAKPPILPVSPGTSREETIELIVNGTIDFLNSEYDGEGPGICHW